MLPGTPRYTPAWEKIGSIVPRAEEFEEWEKNLRMNTKKNTMSLMSFPST
ncbi:MAG: hypothetical protein QXU63_01260 [Nitrososphaerota archaeon]